MRPGEPGTPIDGAATVLCEGALGTPNGKTAHGLCRYTERYRVLSVIDSRQAGRDAGEVIDGRPSGIPVVDSLAAALGSGEKPGRLVVGLAPDGGKLPPEARSHVLAALRAGLHVDSGLHTYLSDDPEFSAAAAASGARIRDVRRPRPVSELHFFTGRIEEVEACRVAVLGTDSAVGKRTTALLLRNALRARGRKAFLVGTGQTAWMQGMRYSIVLDSIVNDFVSGEIENAILECWDRERPDVILLEGQGSLTNPAYPGGFELLAAGRPHGIVLQHAPARKEYDGFPGFPLGPLDREIALLQMLSRRPVVALTINHEGMTPEEVEATASAWERLYGIPACDPLRDGVGPVADALERLLPRRVA